MTEVDSHLYVNATRIIIGIDSLILIEFAALIYITYLLWLGSMFVVSTV